MVPEAWEMLTSPREVKWSEVGKKLLRPPWWLEGDNIARSEYRSPRNIAKSTRIETEGGNTARSCYRSLGNFDNSARSEVKDKSLRSPWSLERGDTDRRTYRSVRNVDMPTRSEVEEIYALPKLIRECGNAARGAYREAWDMVDVMGCWGDNNVKTLSYPGLENVLIKQSIISMLIAM